MDFFKHYNEASELGATTIPQEDYQEPSAYEESRQDEGEVMDRESLEI